MCAGAAKLEQRRMLPVHTPPLVRSVSRGGPPLLRHRALVRDTVAPRRASQMAPSISPLSPVEPG